MTYRPTPDSLERDVYTLLSVLAIATRNLDRLGYPTGGSGQPEEVSAGLCYGERGKG